MLILIRKKKRRLGSKKVLKGGSLFHWSVIQDNFLLLFSVAWKAGAQALNA